MTGASADPRRVRPATVQDVDAILAFVGELAAYERIADEVVATAADLREWLFGPRPAAEALIAEIGDTAAGFAVYFQTFSTFLGRPGLYLEDLFVRPAWRRRGLGRLLLAHVARIAVDRGCGRLEWSVLDWNELALGVYRKIGARPMDQWTVHRLTGSALQSLAAEGGAAAPPPAGR
jgi:GNAT superfamily N-acetyltransferase